MQEVRSSPSALARMFSRLMASLAVVVALAASLVPPITAYWVGLDELENRAQAYAGQLAHLTNLLVERDPILWPYAVPQTIQAASTFQLTLDIGRIVVMDGPRILFAPDPRIIGTGATDGPEARAPILAGDRKVAEIVVVMDASRHRRTLWYVAAASLPIGLALGLLLFFFPALVVRRQARSLERTEQHLREANRALAERCDAANGNVRALSVRVLEEQERERRRLARELHDAVGQCLTAVQIGLELIQAQPEGAQTRIGRLIASCHEGLAELRRIVRDLRPQELEQGSRLEALRAVTERFEERTGIPASLRCDGDLERCPEVVVVNALRMLQEALTNVARHAQAKEVRVAIAVGGSELRLKIEDDGRGFEADGVATGTGLTGVRERCALLGGQCLIRSSPGAGTTLEALLPFS